MIGAGAQRCHVAWTAVILVGLDSGEQPSVRREETESMLSFSGHSFYGINHSSTLRHTNLRFTPKKKILCNNGIRSASSLRSLYEPETEPGCEPRAASSSHKPRERMDFRRRGQRYHLFALRVARHVRAASCLPRRTTSRARRCYRSSSEEHVSS